MTSIALDDPPRKVIVGVDTHKHIHVAVAIDHHGARLGDLAVSADTGGYAQLEGWARALGRIDRFGIEGTGSYGAGLTSYLRRCGHRIIEVNRGDRRARRQNGKSDTLDAEAAARSVLAGTATTIPETADGLSEMIRQVKIARDTARKGRTSAIITLKQVVVNAPAELRESLDGLPDKALIDRCAGYRPKTIDTTTASAKHTLRALARRWLDLDTEIRGHDAVLDGLTAQASPTLRDGYGIGPDCAAEILIVFGDNPERIRSEAAFAKLCGTCPIPASSGLTNKHRLYRGGHRQANAALYRTVIVRMRFHQPTIDYVTRRTAEGLTKKDIIRCLKRFPRPRGLPERHDRPPRPDHRDSELTNPGHEPRRGFRHLERQRPETTRGPSSANRAPHHEQPRTSDLIYRGVNALAETTNGLYKWELIYRQGPWAGIEDVEFATMTYVDWFNNRRLHGTITPGAGYTTPAAHEAAHYRQTATGNLAATQ